ncbi:MAG: hypothetical protein Q7S76_01570, partial [bacterium]|nr:hypothetical protein [bacterium]
NSLFTRYSMYFNKKYKRVGPLFQGVYKAVLVNNNEQLLYLTRYIHRNIIAAKRKIDLASQGEALRSWSYSSYPEYIGKRKTNWVKPQEILSFFSTSGFSSYQAFVEESAHDEMQSLSLRQLNLYA